VKRKVTLDHGEGGAATARLLNEVFLPHLGKPPVLEDATEVACGTRMAVTTDGFVIKPLFFPGGDIGELAVTGSINDLAVMGAVPLYLTAGFILEEGLEIATLERIVRSMALTAKQAGVRVLAGDTKVVQASEADQIFIVTTGVGLLPDGVHLSSASCLSGDAVLVSGPIADHGATIAVVREAFSLESDLESDCACVHELAQALLGSAPDIRCMRDPTRGGIATTLFEIAGASKVGILLREETIPIRKSVAAICDLLGIDPLYCACEGRFVAVVPADQREAALQSLRCHPLGAAAEYIGDVVAQPAGVHLETRAGGVRTMYPLEGVQLPRIC
jgi:hydrogenase expression/formation protein HypE